MKANDENCLKLQKNKFKYMLINIFILNYLAVHKLI